MSLSFTVGGTRGLFDDRFAREVAGALDNAFGAEGDWEGYPPRHFGELAGTGWSALQRRAVAELGAESLPNLLAAGSEGRGVYLPTHVNAMTLTLSAGGPLRCASLPSLRRELAELAGRWGVPLDDESLEELVRGHDGAVADDPEIAAFARLSLAANEAVRRDCPLWLLGEA